jgi:hypothetical protein
MVLRELHHDIELSRRHRKIVAQTPMTLIHELASNYRIATLERLRYTKHTRVFSDDMPDTLPYHRR